MDPHNASAPAPGWYPDPLDPTLERLWEGERWSERTRPAASASLPPPPPPPPASTQRLGASAVDPGLEESQPAPPTLRPPGDDRGRRFGSGRSWSIGSVIGIGLALMSLLLVGGCVVALVAAPLAVRSQDTVEFEADFEIAEPRPAPVPMTTTMEPFAVEPTTTVGPGMPGFDGSAALFGYGTTDEVHVTLDTGEPLLFEISVGEPVDMTEEVLAANPLNAEPLEGVVHAAIPVTLVVVQSPADPFPTADAFDWAIVGGATAALYRPAELTGGQFGCGAIDDDLTAVEEMSLGVEYAGRVCIAIPADDLAHPDTRVGLTVGLGESFVWTR